MRINKLIDLLPLLAMLTVAAPMAVGCATTEEQKPDIRQRAEQAGQELDEEVEKKNKRQQEESQGQ